MVSHPEPNFNVQFFKNEINNYDSAQQQKITRYHSISKFLEGSPVLNTTLSLKLESSQWKKQYETTRQQTLQACTDLRNEYTSLCERGVQIEEKRVALADEKQKLEQEQKKRKDTTKEDYYLLKKALKIAYDRFNSAFGMEVTVADRSYNDVIVASVVFKQQEIKIPIKLAVNRASKEILDVDCSKVLSSQEQDDLRKLLQQKNNLGFIVQLRNQMLKNVCCNNQRLSINNN